MYSEILFSLKKERYPAICDNTDGSGGHYAKWNRLDTERQILYYFTYIRNLKLSKLIEAESGIVVARSWVKREMG